MSPSTWSLPPKHDIVEPKRKKFLSANVLPMETLPSIERVAHMRLMPITASEEPQGKKLRTESEAPKVVQSNTAKDGGIRDKPPIDIVAPSRATDRKDRDAPKQKKSTTDIEEPTRGAPTKLMDAPRRANHLIDKEAPMCVWARTD
jgi:hypothetical protein